MPKKLITQEESDMSLENIKQQIGMEMYNKSLDESIFYFRYQLSVLEKLKNDCLVINENTFLKECIYPGLKLILTEGKNIFIERGVNEDINTLTLKQFYQLSLK